MTRRPVPAHRRAWTRSVATVLAAAILAPACGEGDGATGGRGDTSAAVERVARTRARQAAGAAQAAGLPPPVQDFVGRAAGAVAHTFTVTYAGPAGGRTTLTQRPPERRLDVTTAEGAESSFHLEGGAFLCRRPPRGAWVCEQRPVLEDPDVAPFAPGNVDRTVSALAATRHAYRFDVTSRPLAGTTATCLVTTPMAGGEGAELCIAPSGAVLLVDSGPRRLEATAYEDEAHAKALRLPARARPGPPVSGARSG